MVRIGIDVGSTTAKIVALDEKGEILFHKYVRHNARAKEVVEELLGEIKSIASGNVSIAVTGSVGMGLAERMGLPFVQEVVAAAKAVRERYGEVRSMIDIGGEDAKVVFFENGEAKDLRMNGNCAGGTGAFIDQMAVILGVDVKDMNELALNAKQIYPIASRCGVFCKTDIQNLIAKNVSKEDIAASIFHAVAVQTVVTLAHGCDITAPVLFCGGPLTFIPALRKAFKDYLHLSDDDIILPEHGALLPAIGAALSEECSASLSEECGVRSEELNVSSPEISSNKSNNSSLLTPHSSLHTNNMTLPKGELKAGEQDVFLGIDSGSTTTKIVVTDAEGKIVFHYYKVNGGNPVQAVEKGLVQLDEECKSKGTELNIVGSCSTGYGEDLIKAAFQLDSGIVETIAHYMAAATLDPKVSFILDIGGQDMKAMWVNGGVVDRIEINEACSSGCGSFIETFAKTLGYTVSDFAQAACQSQHPCDLGTRCTVFMNSKVKQVLREGATVSDIAAGLAYSVVKNCLYKVLKLKDASVLGNHIVVQGGTMRNDGVVRALEILTGAEVSRCDMPELMGAYGCALYAKENASFITHHSSLITKSHFTTKLFHCKGCDNQCLVSRYHFDSGKDYYSGNRCERVFSNNGVVSSEQRVVSSIGANVYREKYRLLFDAQPHSSLLTPHSSLNIGLPRCLNIYEDLPFWRTLFEECGINVVVSDPSKFNHYEHCARMVMSDNICFPAKLVHSHIDNLIEKGVDRIFMPFVVYERSEDEQQNSFNCPIVTGYSEVIKSVQSGKVPIDSPSISFKDRKMLYRECLSYVKTLGIDEPTLARAFIKAEEAQDEYIASLVKANDKVIAEARRDGRLVILMAGRPYHTDPLIQHKIADIIAGMGIDVITDDIVRRKEIHIDGAHYLAQWTYPNHLLKAAEWCADKGDGVEFVQLTSFGCGPDAFLVDEARSLLMRHGKAYTMLKLDDINNVGSMKLRVCSLIESLKLSKERKQRETEAFKTTPIFSKDMRHKKILVPFFTPFISPLIPSIMHVAGYDGEALPLSDKESAEWGLKYANNEVCYPATLIVGDIIKALKSGRYDPDNVVVAMTQTGGQCRASNYISLIKRALVDAGYANTAVISLTFGDEIKNDQPGFKVNWAKILPVALRAVLFSDVIAKFYYASAAREKGHGQAALLRDHFLSKAQVLIENGRSKELYETIALAAHKFNEICIDMDCPRVGIVGEIFLKFNPFAQKGVTDWLINMGIEVVPSSLTDFFTQAFVNGKVRKETNIERLSLPDFVYKMGYKYLWGKISKVNKLASEFKYFMPFHDIFAEAVEASQVVNLNAQFGEGWLLPAEIFNYAHEGVDNVISLQPFGCIANHIVARGIEKRVKSLLPHLNLLSLDFDSGVSEVNVANRLLLFLDNVLRVPRDPSDPRVLSDLKAPKLNSRQS